MFLVHGPISKIEFHSEKYAIIIFHNQLSAESAIKEFQREIGNQKSISYKLKFKVKGKKRQAMIDYLSNGKNFKADISVNSNTIDRITSFYNKESQSQLKTQKEANLRKEERESLIQKILRGESN